jgi:hypothetical protein
MPLRLDNEGELREAQAALFNINSTSGWLLLNYVGLGGQQAVHFAAGGEGGVDELVRQFEDDQIQYLIHAFFLIDVVHFNWVVMLLLIDNYLSFRLEHKPQK